MKVLSFFARTVLCVRREMGSSGPGSFFPLVLTRRAALGGAGWHFGGTQLPFSSASFLFRSFPFMFREAVLALSMLNVHSLGEKLALNLFVYSNANRMLGDAVDASGSAIVTSAGHSFLTGAHPLDVYNVTFLVNLWPKKQLAFSERPRERIAGASPLPLANYRKMVVCNERKLGFII